MACVLDPDIAVLFFSLRQQKLICRLLHSPNKTNSTDFRTAASFPKDACAPVVLPAFSENDSRLSI